ncbi:MAG: NAD(P)/FAD-dependent oxidoreductase [Candidatus Methanofastidiosia archaeon]
MIGMYDVVIIGAGPAGLTAAIYCIRSNLKTVVLEKEFAGGQIAYAGIVENYPGFPEGIKGFELGQKLAEHAQKLGTEIKYTEVEKVDFKKMAVYTGNEEITTQTIIIATGLKHRELEVLGEQEFKGRGVVYCTTCDGPLYANKRTVVVGSGIPAITAALYLDEIAKNVVIISSKPQLKAKESVYLDKIKKSSAKIINNAKIKEIRGTDFVKSVVIKNKDSGKEEIIETDGIFVNIGKLPNTSFLKGTDIKLTKKGFIEIDKTQKTSIDGVYAVGDVTIDPYKQVSTAVGDGCRAALSINKLLKKGVK